MSVSFSHKNSPNQNIHQSNAWYFSSFSYKTATSRKFYRYMMFASYFSRSLFRITWWLGPRAAWATSGQPSNTKRKPSPSTRHSWAMTTTKQRYVAMNTIFRLLHVKFNAIKSTLGNFFLYQKKASSNL